MANLLWLDRLFCKVFGHKEIEFDHELTGFRKTFNCCLRCGRILAYDHETETLVYQIGANGEKQLYH